MYNILALNYLRIVINHKNHHIVCGCTSSSLMSTHLCAKCASGLLPLSSSLNRSWQQENGPTRKDFGNIFSQKKTVVRFWDNFKYEKSPPVDPPPAVVRLGLNSSRCRKLPKYRPGYHCTLHCLLLHCNAMDKSWKDTTAALD